MRVRNRSLLDVEDLVVRPYGNGSMVPGAWFAVARAQAVAEHAEDTASGCPVENGHTVLAKWHSANLASGIKKDLNQKVKLGFPTA